VKTHIRHFKHLESHIYPGLSELWNISHPPSEFFAEGTEPAFQLLEKLPERGLAIVGTRNPQPRSVQFATQKILELQGSGLIILSGLARGIDAAAHSAALRASLPTIAIIGAGLDLDYPRENAQLRKNILASGGLIISEFPVGTQAYGSNFLRRNRLIAGWSKATWVVEAANPSGALSTANWAREQNRTCLATPCFPQDSSLTGNQMLLDRDHALAFWGIHSLGAVWLDLATFKTPKASFPLKPMSQRLSPEEKALSMEVGRLMHLHGGAPVQDLFTWASRQGWNPQIFFTTLRSLIKKNHATDRNGIFTLA